MYRISNHLMADELNYQRLNITLRTYSALPQGGWGTQFRDSLFKTLSAKTKGVRENSESMHVYLFITGHPRFYQKYTQIMVHIVPLGQIRFTELPTNFSGVTDES